MGCLVDFHDRQATGTAERDTVPVLVEPRSGAFIPKR